VVVRGEHRSLPHLALLQLAIAEQAEDGGAAVGALARDRGVEPQRERDPVGQREPLAERAGRDLHAGRLASIGMPLQHRAELAQRREPLDREVAGLGKRCVEHGRRVALRQHEAVALGPGRLGRIVPHHAEVQGRDDLHGGQGAAGVTGARSPHHPDDVAAHRTCDLRYRFTVRRHVASI
jgi:hypothetical protein